MRKGTPTTYKNSDSQCGNAKQGKSNFEVPPGNQAEIKWKVTHADKEGLWRIRISEGFSEDDETYQIIKPDQATTDELGWFTCGRYSGKYENRKITFPKLNWDLWVLQLQFKTAKGIIQQCADISIIEKHVGWTGLCKNGGVCRNGQCICPKGYGGNFCDGIGVLENKNPSLWLILLIILLIIIIMAIFIMWVIRFVNRQEKNYHKTSPRAAYNNDFFEGTIFQNDDDNDVNKRVGDVYEDRLPYKHKRFEDEE